MAGSPERGPWRRPVAHLRVHAPGSPLLPWHALWIASVDGREAWCTGILLPESGNLARRVVREGRKSSAGAGSDTRMSGLEGSGHGDRSKKGKKESSVLRSTLLLTKKTGKHDKIWVFDCLILPSTPPGLYIESQAQAFYNCALLAHTIKDKP